MLGRSELDRSVEHVLEAVLEHSGYDFQDYQLTFVIRRLRRVAERHGMAGDLPELAARVGEDPSVFVPEIIHSFSLGVTEMFRDPPFWSALRTSVLPELHGRHSVRAWVAGCATGEEAFSLAIAMREEGVHEGCRIYATDINEVALARARLGLLQPGQHETDQDNYRRSGGTGALSDHLTADRLGVALDASTFVFARHNLVSDAAFNSFDLVLCRNVLIYFNADLHRRVHDTLFNSLLPGAVLGLGARESCRASAQFALYDTIDVSNRLYRRRR